MKITFIHVLTLLHTFLARILAGYICFTNCITQQQLSPRLLERLDPEGWIAEGIETVCQRRMGSTCDFAYEYVGLEFCNCGADPPTTSVGHGHLCVCVCVCVCVRVCMCACVCVCVWTFVARTNGRCKVYMRVCAYWYTYKYTCLNIYIHTYKHTYIFTCINAYKHTYVHTYIDT